MIYGFIFMNLPMNAGLVPPLLFFRRRKEHHPWNPPVLQCIPNTVATFQSTLHARFGTCPLFWGGKFFEAAACDSIIILILQLEVT